jgi:hypothetical protein
MATTKQDISEWFDEGVKKGATHMLVVCDTFEYEDYPVYVMPGQSAVMEASNRDGKNMQKVMECYRLRKDMKDVQLSFGRCNNYQM